MTESERLRGQGMVLTGSWRDMVRPVKVEDGSAVLERLIREGALVRREPS